MSLLRSYNCPEKRKKNNCIDFLLQQTWQTNRQFSFSGFDGQNPAVFFQTPTENLQQHIDQGNVSVKDETANININNTNITENGSAVSTADELVNRNTHSNINALRTDLENSETVNVNLSVPISQPENVLHVDFHVGQPANLLHIAKPNETGSEPAVKAVQTGLFTV